MLHAQFICTSLLYIPNNAGESINHTTTTVLHDSREAGLEVNREKLKYMMMSHHQNALQTLQKRSNVQIHGKDN